MKFIVVTLVVAVVIWWWLERRRAVIRHRHRLRREARPTAWREAPPALGATPLLRCRACGAYRVKGAQRCDRRDCPRG